MTDFDDNDKTRFKPKQVGSVDDNRPDDDRTQIVSPKTTASSPDVAEDKTRILTKAPVSSAQQVDDKTRLAHKKLPPEDRTRISVKGSKPLDDKTRLAVEKKRAALLKKKQELLRQKEEAKKVAAGSTESIDTPENPITGRDKTRFASPDDVRTEIADGPAVVGDKTQMFQRGEETNPFKLAKAEAQKEADSADEGGSHGLLKKRFVLEQVLGAGGMGVVYKAKDLLKIEAQDRDPYVAVKVLSEEFKSHPEAFIALQRESRKSQRIAHPNIVNVHDFDRDGDTVFMTMEFLDGKPLDKLISQYRSTGLPFDEVLTIVEGISAALMHAHNEKIIHSDFKPGNIFVTNKGVAKVFDFGIARAVAKAEHFEDSVDDKTVFDAGNLGALTPAYASLEMLEGSPPDIRDDIYALGCIAYELFTGQHPYNRVHADEAARQNLKPKRITGIKKHQWKAIEKAIAFKRPDRSVSVDAFLSEFSTKASSSGKLMAAFIVLLIIAGAAFYEFGPRTPSDFKEDEVRSEIEIELRLELQTKAINELLKAMNFDPNWEDSLWQEIQSARQLMGENDPWLVGVENKIYASYVEKIGEVVEQKEFELAQLWLENARRYASENAQLDVLNLKVTEALEAKEREEKAAKKRRLVAQQQKKAQAQQEKVAAERRSEYEAALKNVNGQLMCRSNINMKDLDIAITKLRSLDMPRYQKEESRFVSSLAVCLEKIGKNFPERAKDSKKKAMRVFEGNDIIAGIKIIPKDPCGSSIAGLGARGKRAICRDRIPLVGRGPSMVVVPGKGNIKSFAIGKYEVSVGEINDYCQASGECSEIKGVQDSLPITNIPYSLAKNYLKWLSNETKKKYRIPTMAEWTYAAKAGKNRLDSNRNCKLSSRGIQKGGSLLKSTVGQQNAWGLINHVGNAREWVSQKGGALVVVGGSYNTSMENCNFKDSEPHTGSGDALTGFRVLREVDTRS